MQEISGGEDHPRGPPRIEFSYIRQLQQDNAELRTLLEEHQAALEIIMRRYRDQVEMDVLLLSVPLFLLSHHFPPPYLPLFLLSLSFPPSLSLSFPPPLSPSLSSIPPSLPFSLSSHTLKH